jgi:hypothetical protein
MPRAMHRRKSAVRGGLRRGTIVWLAIGWLTSAVAARPVAGQSVAAEVSISPSVAGLFIGEDKIVEGLVVAAQREGNVVHLQLGTPPQAVIVNVVVGLLSKFPSEPERYYLGKTVRVAGAIQSFRGTVEMTIHDPALIAVVDASLPPAAGVAAPAVSAAPPVLSAPPPASGPAAAREPVPAAQSPLEERLETLSERLRALEERVDQLEHAGAPAAGR